MRKVWIFWLVLIIISPGLGAQGINSKLAINKEVDSLTKQLKQVKNRNYEFLRKLEKVINRLDSAEAIHKGTQITKMFGQYRTPLFAAMSPAFMAYIYNHKGVHVLATEQMKEAIEIAESNQMMALQGELYRDYGHIQNGARDGHSIKSFFKSYEIFQKIHQQTKAVHSLYNAATTQYGSDVSPDKKIYAFRRVIRLGKDSIPHRDIINSHTAIGMIYIGMKQYKKAEKELTDAMEIATTKKDSAWIGILSGNFSQLYQANKAYDKALKYLAVDLRLSKKNKQRLSLAFVYGSFGDIYREIKKYELAKTYYDSCIAESRYNRFQEHKKDVLYRPLEIGYYGLAKVYVAWQMFTKAYKYRDLSAIISDTLKQRALKSKVNQIQAAYNVGKKQKEILLLTKEKEINKATIQRQNLINIATGGGLVLMLLLAIVLFRSNRERKKKNSVLKSQQNEIITQNEELFQQREEILSQQEFVEKQNKELTLKNQQIGHSIQAARLIQKAVLPYQDKLDSLLKDYFVLYRPKDVVSGDFYWLNKIEHKTILIAADCTGHGVPGAFMSLICNTLFDKIIRVWGITDSVKILQKAQSEIRVLLRQKDLGYANGMDVCLVVMEDAPNDQVKVQFTGAKRPLYVMRQGQTNLDELRGNRISIGGRSRKDKHTFTKHELLLEKGSLLYLASDGYADQNNEKRKSFTAKQMKTLIEGVAMNSMAEQQQILEANLDEYMKGTEQRDDIMVIGVRLS